VNRRYSRFLKELDISQKQRYLMQASGNMFGNLKSYENSKFIMIIVAYTS
jgi:hypothetical protein